MKYYIILSSLVLSLMTNSVVFAEEDITENTAATETAQEEASPEAIETETSTALETPGTNEAEPSTALETPATNEAEPSTALETPATNEAEPSTTLETPAPQIEAPIVVAPITVSQPVILNRLPQQFVIKERFFALTHTFDIYDGQQIFGRAQKKFFAWTPTYILKDWAGEDLAKARAHFFSWFTTVDVTSMDESYHFGQIREEFSIFRPSFLVIDRNGQILARAQSNIWQTCFTFQHPVHQDRILAKMTRPFFSFFGHTWTIRIEDDYTDYFSGDNAVLFALVAVYRTDAERAAQARQNNQAVDDLIDAAFRGKQGPHFSTEQMAELDGLLQQLQQYTAELEGVEEPSEAELEALAIFAEAVFANELDDVVAVDSETNLAMERTLRLVAGLLPYLDSSNEELTLRQREVLYSILMNQVKSLYPCS